MPLTLNSASETYRKSYIEGGDTIHQYCNKVFGGWDYCICEEKASELKKKSIAHDIKVSVNDIITHEIYSSITSIKFGHKSIVSVIAILTLCWKVDLAEEIRSLRAKQRSTKEKFIIYTKRLLLNIVIVALLCAAGVAIYFAARETIEARNRLHIVN